MKARATFRISSYLVLILVVLASSCQSPSKLVQKQKYNKAFDRILKDLRKGKEIDQETRYALEDAFSSSTARDMAYIESMKTNSRIDNWDLIYDRALVIETRQHKLQPYLPVYDSYGSRANFQFVKTQIIKDLAAKASTDQYYNQVDLSMIRAKNGDKIAARTAHNYLGRIERYRLLKADHHLTKSKAKEWGITHVKVEVENHAFGYLSHQVKGQIEHRLGRKLNNGQWIKFDVGNNKTNYDYAVQYHLNTLDVSPDNYFETRINEEKVIEDSYFQTDDNGDYVLDAEGNKIKIITRETIRATVIKVLQTKEAQLAGDLVIRDLTRNEIVDDRPIIVEKVFEKESCTFIGDERALSNNLPNLGPPISFPRDEELMRDALDELESIFQDLIDRSGLI